MRMRGLLAVADEFPTRFVAYPSGRHPGGGELRPVLNGSLPGRRPEALPPQGWFLAWRAMRPIGVRGVLDPARSLTETAPSASCGPPAAPDLEPCARDTRERRGRLPFGRHAALWSARPRHERTRR
ncbi:hypothetical protein GCM10010331_18460 [Streptomyces xanthochromogenes]|nr:hypothetical protein GCM10010331_18460 [Streptomyces xanthochromogenes]